MMKDVHIWKRVKREFYWWWIEMKELIFFVSFLLVLILGTPVVAIYYDYQIDFRKSVATIQETRRALNSVDKEYSHVVIAQAVKCNQAIAEMKAMNKMSFVGLFIPDGWDEIEPIQVGGER